MSENCCDVSEAGGSNDQFNFIEGRKGRILIRARHRYYLHHILGDGAQVWQCLQKKCSAKMKILGATILRQDNHVCTLPNEVIEDFKNECLTRAKNEVTPIPKIYESTYKVFADKGYNFVCDSVSFKSIKSVMYRARNSKLNVNKTIFKTPDSVEIPNKFQDFLLCRDSGIIAFASSEGRNRLNKSEICLMDGTFRSCPAPFYQLFSIHVDMGSTEKGTIIHPVVFILLANKEQQTYENMFNIIKLQLPHWNPKKIIVDFEIALINSIKTVFPGTVIKGCNFHFQKALKKKQKELNIVSEPGKYQIKKCGALAHLPVEKVEDGWLSIMEESPDDEATVKFNDYFVATWLENSQFPMSLWNCEGERHRTTNAVEAWHKRLNTKICKKPRLLDFFENIRAEATHYERFMVRENRKSRSINRDIRLKVILSNLKSNNISLLQAIHEITKV